MTPHDVLLDAFDTLRDAIDDEFVGRTQEIELTRVGLVSKHNIFEVSEPGTGKTLRFDRTVIRIEDCVGWGLQFTRHSLPDDVFGPLSLTGLQADRRFRQTKGYLPEAHLALLDEFPRAAEATANGMLEAINERRFNQDGQKVPLKLWIAIATANTMLQAEHDGLGACADRFMLRLKPDQLGSVEAWQALWDAEFPPNPPTVITWAQVVEAHEQAMQVKVDVDVFNAAVKMRRKIAELGITISDRRWRELKRVIQAAAWLSGRTTAEVGDLEWLFYCFWEDPTQIEAVSREVAAIASPNLAKALEISDGIVSIIEDVDKTMGKPVAERENAGVQILSKIKEAGRKARDLAETSSGRSERILGDSLSRLEKLYEKHAAELLNLPQPIPFSMFLDIL